MNNIWVTSSSYEDPIQVLVGKIIKSSYVPYKVAREEQERWQCRLQRLRKAFNSTQKLKQVDPYYSWGKDKLEEATRVIHAIRQ